MKDESKDKKQLIGELEELRQRVRESLATEATLREKELELYDFIEKAALGLRRVGSDGVILWANKAEMDMLGYTPEEYIGHSFAEFAVDEEVITDMFARLGSDEGLDNFEVRMLHKDGSVRDVLISSNVLWKDGEFIHTRCCTRDVTVRKGVEGERSKRNRDLEILSAITQAVHQSLDLEEVYDIALDMTTTLENVDMAFIYLVDEARSEAVLQAHKNLPEEYISRAGRIAYPKGITWEVINSGQITNIEDIQDEPNIGPAGRTLGHHSNVGIPIVLEEQVIGVIWFTSYKERRFNEREVELLSTIGNQVALAISKAKLYTELAQKSKYENMVSAITQAVHQSLDLDEVYDIALDMTTALENVDMAFIYLVDEDRTEAVLQAQRNLPESYIRRAGRIAYPKGITWEVINSGQITNIEDLKVEPNIGPAGINLGQHSTIGIPIILEEKAIGVIWFTSYKERRFSESEVELLSTIGNQVALAIAKAKLYTELAKKNRYENIVSAVTQSVHRSIDLPEVMENAVEAMSENIAGADRVAIFLVEGNEAVMKAYRGYPDWFAQRMKSIPYPKGFTWKTIIEGEPRYVPDVDKDTAIGPAGREVGTQSYVSMPIKHGEKSIGSINIYWLEKNAFDEEDLDLLEIVANQIEIAIQNANQAEALRESEERYRTLVENSYDLIIEISVFGRFLYISPNHKFVLGYEPSELSGKSIFEHVHPDDRKIVLESFEKDVALFSNAVGIEFRDVMSGNISQLADPEGLRDLKKKLEITVRERPISAQSTIYRYRHKNGNWLWLESTGLPFVTSTGEIRVVITSRDITEREKMEKDLLKVKKLESIGVLAGGIAHDFNNLLSAILGGISLAKRGLEQGDTKLAILEQTELACDRAANLTNQLLTFSMGGGPVKELASIAEIIKTSAGFVLRGSNVGYEFTIPDDISTVEVDPGQISQVIQNIVINAKQAMHKYGMIKLCVEDVVINPDQGLPLEEGKYVKISIEDEGEGIPEAQIDKIFDPYFTTKQEGSGLGLATTYSIIDKHGGLITVESEVGVGTRFDIYLPASEGKPLAKAAVKELQDGRAKILVMDDDTTVRGIVINMLASLGYEVDSAGDGAEAIELYQKARATGKPFDVVIMDLTVQGGMGGKEAIQNLIRLDPEVNAIVSSGYANDPVMADYGKYGFKRSIAKPFRVDKLSEILHEVLHGVITEDAEDKEHQNSEHG